MFGVSEDWTEVAAGKNHTVAIKEDGTLWAWGSNNSGQLGNNSIILTAYPISVSIAKQNWKSIDAGYDYTIAIKQDNTACAWGRNDTGQLGIGISGDVSTPVNCVGPYSPGSAISWLDCNSNCYDYSNVYGIDYNTGLAYYWGITCTNGAGLCFAPRSLSSTISWKQIAAGFTHTVGIDGATNRVYAWGSNSYGQLGDSTRTSRSAPTLVSTTLSWSQIATGIEYTIAIQYGTGLAYGWGNNSYGQLGTGNTTSYSAPASVSSTISWKQIVCGNYHTVGINGATNRVYAWGSNSNGQLGDSTRTNRSAPTSVNTTLSWSQIACGGTQTLAIQYSTNRAYAWGYNNYGELGTGNTTSYSAPASVSTTLSWSQIACGNYHTIATKYGTGLAYAWGRNDYGQLGDGSTTNRSAPTSVSSTISWKNIKAGEDFTLTINGTDALYAWGRNSLGQLGINSNTNYSVPNIVNNPEFQLSALQFKDIVCVADIATENESHTVGIEFSTGLAYAWGSNDRGQLGDNTINDSFEPKSVSSTISWKQISTGGGSSGSNGGDGFTIGIDGATNRAYAWGRNDYGQLGDGSTTDRSVPTSVSSTLSWSKIACGQWHTIAIQYGTGLAYTWGKNTYGQLGDSSTTNRSAPTSVSSTISWRDIQGGSNYTVGIASDNKLWSWGENSFYELGLGLQSALTSRSVPTSVSITNVLIKNLSVGCHCSLITRNDGSIWGWGYNNYSQLGLNQYMSMSYPVQCLTTKTFSYVVMGEGTTLAIESSTDLAWGWGRGTTGAIGNNSLENAYEPRSVSSTISWKQLAVGDYHSAGIDRTTGLGYTWGNNSYGQLGTGNLTSTSIPVSVSSIISWKQLVTTGNSTIGINGQTNRAYAWGYNNYGELGTGNTTSYSTPASVSTTLSWSQIAAGGNWVVAIQYGTNRAYAWGYNLYGNLGDGTISDRSAPKSVSTTLSWSKVACSDVCSFGIQYGTGLAYGWGYNGYGGLGDNSTTNRSVPTSVSSTISWSDIIPGAAYTIGIQGGTGLAYAWGKNDYGQLGDNTMTSCSTPVSVSSTISWKQITCVANSWGVLGINGENERLYYWGTNGYGELNSMLVQVDVPQLMPILPGL